MTATEHGHFAEWDAAYVLGTLSPAERRAFEDHLEGCERCRSAVAELSALPGLLGRIDDARAFALLEEAGAPEDHASTADLVARIQAAENRRRLRRTAGGVVALAAAAALASVLTLAIPAALAPAAHADVVAQLSSAGSQAIPIDVSVSLTRTDWGTRLKMDCVYRLVTDPNASYGPAEYSLWVVGTDGSEQPVSSWNSSPGTEVRLDAATGTELDDIAHLDLRNADGTQVIMSGEVSAE